MDVFLTEEQRSALDDYWDLKDPDEKKVAMARLNKIGIIEAEMYDATDDRCKA